MIMNWKRTVQASTATKTWFFNIPLNTFIFSMSLELISLKTYKKQQFIDTVNFSKKEHGCQSIC